MNLTFFLSHTIKLNNHSHNWFLLERTLTSSCFACYIIYMSIKYKSKQKKMKILLDSPFSVYSKFRFVVTPCNLYMNTLGNTKIINSTIFRTSELVPGTYAYLVKMAETFLTFCFIVLVFCLVSLTLYLRVYVF